MAMIETKDKILDTAERLFGDNGFGATSLRQIIAEARVNLAAVHYHFGSKEDLLDAVVVRKLAPINAERIELLSQAAALTGGEPLAIEQFLEAFLWPAVRRAGHDPAFTKLMGRLHGEGLMPRVVAKNFQEIAARFLGGLRRALPGIPEDEVVWRIHFMVGAMAQTLKGPPEYPGIATANPIDPETLLRWMVAFLSAGFRAPATQSIPKAEMQA
jgi:AcrR family transcriptional regulator